MQSNPSLPVVNSPKLIPSFIKGFNSIASHVEVILFPIALDILLWLGPHLGIKTIFKPLFNEILSMANLNSSDMADISAAFKSVWTFIGDRYNLASILRTYPVGIPSLISGLAPIQTPMGTAPGYQVPSFFAAFGLSILIFIIGLFIGSIYFHCVARVTYPETVVKSIKSVGTDFIQVCLLTFSLFLLLLVISIPCFLVISVVSIFNYTIAQIVLFLIAGLIIWLLIPLLFSPHGIFVYHQNAVQSIITSVRVIRLAMPGSLSFIFLAFIINQLLDMLWEVPPENSWMMLVGIAGHAFIATGLLSASFVYYNEAFGMLKEVIQKKSPAPQESNA